MKHLLGVVIFLFIIICSSLCWSYTNLTPEQVYTKLVKQDTFLILDVREVYEYITGHIAEPEGQLPITPANIPWSSGVLTDEFDRLPREIDIIVTCRSGGRSAAASAFLETKGFNKIYNMTGGFSSWSYESRKDAYGDHSGKWINNADLEPIEIICSETKDTSKIIFPSEALSNYDSIYIELHYASLYQHSLSNIPESDIDGLFNITILDPFGLSLFDGDSLVLADTSEIILQPDYEDINSDGFQGQGMKIYNPVKGWIQVEHDVEILKFIRKELVLRKWYNVEGFKCSCIQEELIPTKFEVQVYPNPFNSAVNIMTSDFAEIEIFDIKGRYITTINSGTWKPDFSVSSGTYIVRVNSNQHNIIKKLTYLK